MHERVLQYERLCRLLAYRFAKYGCDREDLEQEGYITIDKALQSYNPDHKANELTYVYICLTRRFWGLVKREQRRNSRFLSVASLSGSQVLYTTREIYEGSELRNLITSLLSMADLTPRQNDIMHRKYYYGQTLNQIATDYGLTRERVRQIAINALKKVRLGIVETDGDNL